MAGLALIVFGLGLLVAWLVWAIDPHRYPDRAAPVDDDGGAEL